MSRGNNKKIVLVNAPIDLDTRYGELGPAGGNEPPLGLCYLASVLEVEGFAVSIIDAQATGLNLGETLDAIMLLCPDYVGISAVSMAIQAASELARMIKERDSGIYTIIGGCHVSALPEETLRKYNYFDAGVVGEGEDTIRELVVALENGADITKVRGVVLKEGGCIYLTQPRPRIKNLDKLPYPAFKLLPDINRFYRVPTQSLAGKYSFSLITSRGCAGKCVFCDRKVFGNYISLHSAEYIIEMVSILNKEYKIDNILFEDDNFMISKDRLRNLVYLMGKNNLKVKWSALARIDNIDKESLRIAKDGGCWQVSYGIESGCQRILDLYKKGINLAQIKETIELTKRAGLRVKCFFMWANPGEDIKSTQETINFIKSLHVDDVSITFFTPFPGSEIWSDLGLYGHFQKNWRKMSCFDIAFEPFGLSKDLLIKTRKKALRDFYFRLGIILSYLARIRSVGQLKELWVSFYHLFRYIFIRND